VGRGDAELPLVAIAELLGQTLDVLRVEQHALDDSDQFLARIGQSEQALALAHEQLDTEFVLEILDVLADPGLRGKQRIRHLGEVEAAPNGFADDPQLLEIHVATLPLVSPGIMPNLPGEINQ